MNPDIFSAACAFCECDPVACADAEACERNRDAEPPQSAFVRWETDYQRSRGRDPSGPVYTGD